MTQQMADLEMVQQLPEVLEKSPSPLPARQLVKLALKACIRAVVNRIKRFRSLIPGVSRS